MKIVHIYVRNIQLHNPEFVRWLEDINLNYVNNALWQPLFEDSIYSALDKAIQMKADFCVIHSFLHVVFDFQALNENLVREFSEKKFLIAGRILETTRGFQLRNQCLLVNMKRYNELCRSIRPELWLHLNDSYQGFLNVVRVPGYDFEVLNFSKTIESTTLWLDPEDGTAQNLQYLNQIKNLTQKELLEIENHSWRRLLQHIQEQYQRRTRTVFLMNTESESSGLGNLPTNIEFDSLWMLPSGFKGLYILSRLRVTKRCKITFFDISTYALEMMRFLLEHWDGLNYVDFIRTALNSPNQNIRNSILNSSDMRPATSTSDALDGLRGFDYLEYKWGALLKCFGSPLHFQESWLKMKQIRPRFTVLDSLNEPHKIEIDASQNSLVWFSNIYNYPLTLLCEGGRRGMVEKFDQLVTHLESRSNQCFILGELPYSGQVVSGFLHQVKKQFADLKTAI